MTGVSRDMRSDGIGVVDGSQSSRDAFRPRTAVCSQTAGGRHLFLMRNPTTVQSIRRRRNRAQASQRRAVSFRFVRASVDDARSVVYLDGAGAGAGALTVVPIGDVIVVRVESDAWIASNGTIISATMLMILISGFTAGPAVSLYGSPTVSPVTADLCASEPLPP